MLCFWVHGCDPGRVSDGSRLALYHNKLSPSSALLLSVSGMRFILLFFLSFCRFCYVFCCVFCCVFALVGAL